MVTHLTGGTCHVRGATLFTVDRALVTCTRCRATIHFRGITPTQAARAARHRVTNS